MTTTSTTPDAPGAATGPPAADMSAADMPAAGRSVAAGADGPTGGHAGARAGARPGARSGGRLGSPEGWPVYRQLIGGAWSDAHGGGRFPDRSPYTGDVIASVPASTASDMRRAIIVADQAAPGWAASRPVQRQEILLRAANIVTRREPEIRALLAAETGCAAAFAGFQVEQAVALLRQAADWPYRAGGEVIASDTPGVRAVAERRPVGVVGSFTPWNGAFVLAFRGVVNPLVWGNTVVVKPSEYAPICAGLLPAEILTEAGLPDGVVNVVTHAPGDADDVAGPLLASPEIACINFTGSSATGAHLAGRAGAALKRTVMELGGRNTLVVLDDADLGQAVDAAAWSAWLHQGQICMSATEILVQRPLYDAVCTGLADRAGQLRAGDPAVPDTDIGPLIHPAARERVAAAVIDAVASGARLLAGGRTDGTCYLPTVLTDVPDGVLLDREEVFGPVIAVRPFDTAADAVARINTSRYGLTCGVIGGQVRAEAVARRVRCGCVHVGGSTIADEPQMPLGGVKASGWGRSGPHSVEDFTALRWLTVRATDGPEFPLR